VTWLFSHQRDGTTQSKTLLNCKTRRNKRRYNAWFLETEQARHHVDIESVTVYEGVRELDIGIRIHHQHRFLIDCRDSSSISILLVGAYVYMRLQLAASDPDAECMQW
jgi:hypothetical protein